MVPVYRSDDISMMRKYKDALEGLRSNTRIVHGTDVPVLIEGGYYNGIWLECGPLEALVYGRYAPEVALASHRIFFRNQRPDGYIPCTLLSDRMLTGQIQSVVPIAATALETAILTGDEQFLEEAYLACSCWDKWLSANRDSRGVGLCEAFCEYDTGHDNSPRFAGLPKQCPDLRPELCPDVGGLPYLAPDLSAMLFGGRVALSSMAAHLNLTVEANDWAEKAESTRRSIMAYCFDPEDLMFYDMTRQGRWLKIRGDLLTRVLGEKVVDQPMFEQIFERHITNPDSFWTPYPLPSIAADDARFDHRLPENSWGGPSQALTALRAPRWFEHYRKPAHLAHLMNQWLCALAASSDFMQQLNPWTGEFIASSNRRYSPAMCVVIEFTRRLFGIFCDQGRIGWSNTPNRVGNCRYYAEQIDGAGLAELDYNQQLGTSLKLNGAELLRVKGICRIVTDLRGAPVIVQSISLWHEAIAIVYPDGREQRWELAPNEEKSLSM